MSLFNRRFALSRKAALVRSGRRDAEGFDDLDEYFAPSVEEEERALMSTDQENIMLDDDNEVTFRPTLKVVKSSPSVREVPLDASIQDYDATPLRRHVEMEVPLKDEHDYGYEGMEMEMEEMKEMKDTGSIKKPKKTKSKTSRSIRSRIESIVMDEDDQNDDEGTRRRSKRKKIAPLAYWKNDRVVYGRRQSSRMPVIVDVLRKEEADQIAGRNGRPRSKNKRQTAERLRAVGFKAKVAVTGTVMDYDTRNETERCKHLYF